MIKRLLCLSFVVVLAACSGEQQTPRVSRPVKAEKVEEKKPRKLADEKTQAERLVAIKELISQGIILNIDKPGTFPRLHVSEKFLQLGPEDRDLVIGLVFYHAFAVDTSNKKEEFGYEDKLHIYYNGKAIQAFDLKHGIQTL